MAEVLNLGLATGATASQLLMLGFGSSASVPDVIPTAPKNLDAQIAEDLTDAFFRLADVPSQWETDLCDAFLRIDMGWAVNASLAASGETAVPVSGGTAVIGIFDSGTSESGNRGGPRWYCKGSDGYAIGQYITIGTEGTFQIDAIDPDGDGLIFECLLSVRT